MFLPISYISLWQMLLPINHGRCFNHMYNTEADVITSCVTYVDRCYCQLLLEDIVSSLKYLFCYGENLTLHYGKQNEKPTYEMKKYVCIQIECQRMWNKKVEVIPLIIGTTGVIEKNIKKYLQ